MDLTITTQFDNALLGRIDIRGDFTYTGATPSNKELTSEIAKKINSKEELVVVKQISTAYSTQNAKFKAVSYKDMVSKAKFEVMTKHLKVKAEKLAKELAEKKAAELEAKQKLKEEAKAAKEAAASEAEPAKEEKSE